MQLHLQEEPFYAYDAFAYQKAGNVYVSPARIAMSSWKRRTVTYMNGTDERVFPMKNNYVKSRRLLRVRRYIIEHPIITLEDRAHHVS